MKYVRYYEKEAGGWETVISDILEDLKNKPDYIRSFILTVGELADKYSKSGVIEFEGDYYLIVADPMISADTIPATANREALRRAFDDTPGINIRRPYNSKPGFIKFNLNTIAEATENFGLYGITCNFKDLLSGLEKPHKDKYPEVGEGRENQLLCEDSHIAMLGLLEDLMYDMVIELGKDLGYPDLSHNYREYSIIYDAILSNGAVIGNKLEFDRDRAIQTAQSDLEDY